jgi:hypothetical protein
MAICTLSRINLAEARSEKTMKVRIGVVWCGRVPNRTGDCYVCTLSLGETRGLVVHAAALKQGEEPLDVAVVGLQLLVVAPPTLVNAIDHVTRWTRRPHLRSVPATTHERRKCE